MTPAESQISARLARLAVGGMLAIVLAACANPDGARNSDTSAAVASSPKGSALQGADSAASGVIRTAQAVATTETPVASETALAARIPAGGDAGDERAEADCECEARSNVIAELTAAYRAKYAVVEEVHFHEIRSQVWGRRHAVVSEARVRDSEKGPPHSAFGFHAFTRDFGLKRTFEIIDSPNNEDYRMEITGMYADSVFFQGYAGMYGMRDKRWAFFWGNDEL